MNWESQGVGPRGNHYFFRPRPHLLCSRHGAGAAGEGSKRSGQQQCSSSVSILDPTGDNQARQVSNQVTTHNHNTSAVQMYKSTRIVSRVGYMMTSHTVQYPSYIGQPGQCVHRPSSRGQLRAGPFLYILVLYAPTKHS